jgi:AraC-like DNA-binding protein
MHANVPEPSLERLCLTVTGVFNATAANPTLSNTRGRRGLAPWQIRKLTNYVEANLDRTITTRCLAQTVRLSPFHFCRAFRDTFGNSPHGYVIRRRMERAQGLMLTTNASLGRIAADCGLADQAHFNKLFRKFAGESPGAWRRARASVHQALPRRRATWLRTSPAGSAAPISRSTVALPPGEMIAPAAPPNTGGCRMHTDPGSTTGV